MPQLSLIIAVYKNTQNLLLILKALGQQSFQDFEVIIAEDNEGENMRVFVEESKKNHTFTIKHIAQADAGFRKDMALNKAVAIAQADYLVFIDGDCVPHRHFLKAHFDNQKEGVALYGRRVMLSEKHTQTVLLSQDLTTLSFINLLINKAERLDCGLYLPFLPEGRKNAKTGIWGCNWSIHKKHLIAVNGFDEDYQLPGFGEDVDIEWRLLASGVKLRFIKYKAIQYHLYHQLNYTDTQINENLLTQKKAQNQVYCEHGLDKYLVN
jgi:glycosyltransferase involved in cell wall biosynthesis